MADNDDPVRTGSDPEPTVAHEATPEPAPAPTPAAAPVLKTRWRDRAWTFRAMLAVAAASLVIGGVAGGLIGAAVDDDHQRMERWGPGGRMPPGWQHHGPQWRWDDGPDNGPGGPMMTPFGNGDGRTPQPPAATPSPGATG
jgi:hypothetical protein